MVRDIRIGTLTKVKGSASFIKQTLPHGFESYGLTYWKNIPADLDIAHAANEAIEAVGDRAVLSHYGIFCNPLQDESAIRDWERVIDTAHHFGVNMVTGFTGAVEGKPLPESLAQYKKVWGALAKRAADKGLKIAFENCDMGGTWDSVKWNIAHAPAAWEMMFNAIPSDNIGLQWEPCHQMVSLIDPLPQLRQWIGKVFQVHGKDATIAWDVLRSSGLHGGKKFAWHRTPGFGDTNWTDLISILRINKYTGSIDIEGYHDPVYIGDLEMTGQVHALNYLKQCRGGAYVPNPHD
jgi:sugar phosphate isomerase/epimerase